MILGTLTLSLVFSAIVTYEQIQIGNLHGEIRHMKILMNAGVKKLPAASKRVGHTSFESDTVTAAMKVQDYGPVLPPLVSQGNAFHLTQSSRVHFVGYHLVVLDLQDERGKILPVLFNVEDPETVISWRYLYSFSSR